MSLEANCFSLQQALRLAMERYGSRITVNGTTEFKAQIIHTTVDSQLPITFADPALESLCQALLKKENTHDRPQQDQGRVRRGAGALDQDPLPITTLPKAATIQQEGLTPLDSTGSRTLNKSRHPKASTACEHCPNSVWFASPAEEKCYCRVMFLVTWSSKEPNQITHCDGEFPGQEEG